MTEIEGKRFSSPFISALHVQENQILSHTRDRSLNSLLNENIEHCLPGLKLELWKLPKEKSIKVLDVGCGQGGVVEDLQKEYPKWWIHGFDLRPVPKKIFWEKKKGTDQSDKKSVKELIIKYLPKFNSSKTAEFVQGEASILPYKSNQFDFVYSKFAYSYFPNKLKAIAEVVRVTKPGGVILLQIQPGDAYELVEDQAIAKKLKKRVCFTKISRILKMDSRSKRLTFYMYYKQMELIAYILKQERIIMMVPFVFTKKKAIMNALCCR